MNLLEIKGRDRDNLIALKKEKYANVNVGLESFGYEIVVDCKHWSTNDNDALELLNELPKPIAIMITTENGCDISINDTGVDKYGVPLHKGYITYEEESFAGAVSGIWLRWFYNTQMNEVK